MSDTPPRDLWQYRMANPPPTCPHGTSYALPCYGCGWACPTCGRNYAPWVRECNYSHEDSRRNAAPLVPIPPEAPPSRMVIALPPETAGPDYQRQFFASRAWQEVWPGLQCRYDEPGNPTLQGTPTAIISFRLTPEDSQ